MEITFSSEKPAKIIGWRVKEGTCVPMGQVLFSYMDDDNSNEVKVQRFKSTQPGVISEIVAPKGSLISKGSLLVRLKACVHPTVVADMCAECGVDLKKLEEKAKPSASVAMVHSIPGLKISLEEAQILGKGDEDRLLKQKKLVLLVDLDQTIIHTTNDNIPADLKDVFHFQLWGHASMWYHTKLRPGTYDFLEKISQFYELHICTFGTRSYAHCIAKHLDPEGKLFSDRILSRDECFSQNSKTANLKELFPCGDHMVCIIDDREDVWSFAPNLIHVKPYHYFRHTGDINAPPGLTKQDDDDKVGIDFEKEKSEKSSSSSAQSTSDSKSKPTNSLLGSIAADDLKLSDDDEDDEAAVDEKRKTAPSSVADSINKSKDTSSGVSSNPITSDNVSEDLMLSDSDEDSDSNLKTSIVPSTNKKAAEKEEEACEADREESADEEENTSKSKTADPQSHDQKCSSSEPKEGDTSVTVDSDAKISKQVQEKNDNKSETTKTAAKSENIDVEKQNLSSEKSSDKKDCNEVVTKENIDKSSQNSSKYEDEDDYLMYLEHILKSIHEAFYSLYDQMRSCRVEKRIPDVKEVIPYVRKKVLKNTSIIFSGVIPTGASLERSRAYSVATSLGAHVSEKLIPPEKGTPEAPATTHVVAARLGTAKVNEARRYKGIHVVTPNWLWCCAERWERVEEKLFPLLKKSSVRRNPPAHCSSPDIYRRIKSAGELISPIDDAQPGPSGIGNRQRTPSNEKFMDTINPLLSFSMDEIESMGHEVDDICNESESSSSSSESLESKEVSKERMLRKKRSRSSTSMPELEIHKSSSTSSSDSDSNEDESESLSQTYDAHSGLEKSSRKRKREDLLRTTETETEDEPLSSRFRRGEPLPSDLDCLNLAHDCSDDDDLSFEEDSVDFSNKGDESSDAWMAEALEREFLNDDDSLSQL